MPELISGPSHVDKAGGRPRFCDTYMFPARPGKSHLQFSHMRCAGGWELCCFLSERLLRLVFKDERTGWQNLSYSRIQHDSSAPRSDLKKLIVTILRRKRAGNVAVAGYWGPQGSAPRIPEILTRHQRIALGAMVEHADVWTYQTNLWRYSVCRTTGRR